MPCMSVRIAVLVVPDDRILGRLAPIGMGAAAGTCLVVDLADRIGYRGAATTLGALRTSGFHRSHLQPGREGVAIVSRGDLAIDEALDVTSELVRRWPATVIRMPALDVASPRRPIVVRPFLPELEAESPERVVWQRLSLGQQPPGPSLPPISRGRAQQILRGAVSSRWRWVRSWAQIWRLV